MRNLPDNCTDAMVDRAMGSDRSAYFERWLDDVRECYQGKPGDDDLLDDANQTAWDAFEDGDDPRVYAERVQEERGER